MAPSTSNRNWTLEASEKHRQRYARWVGVGIVGLALVSCVTPAMAATSCPLGESDSVAGLRVTHRVVGDVAQHQPLPLVLAVHGLGDRAEHFIEILAGLRGPARIVAPQAPIPYRMGWSWFSGLPGDGTPSHVVAARVWQATARLERLVRRLKSACPTRGRAIVVGFSQGGVLAFALARHSPNLVRLAVPISGWLPRGLRRGTATAPARVFAVHGGADRLVAPQRAKRSVAHLTANGGQATLKLFGAVGHAIGQTMQKTVLRVVQESLSTSAARRRRETE